MWNRGLMKLPIALFLLLAPGIRAEGLPRKLWKWTVAAVVASSASDIASSMGGKYEMNVLLRSRDGTFGTRGIALKSAMVGGILVSEYLMQRRNPGSAMYVGLAVVNTSLTAATVVTVRANLKVKPNGGTK